MRCQISQFIELRAKLLKLFHEKFSIHLKLISLNSVKHFSWNPRVVQVTKTDGTRPLRTDNLWRETKEKSLHNLHIVREQNTTQTHTHTQKNPSETDRIGHLLHRHVQKARHTWRSTGGETFRFSLLHSQLPFFILRNNHFFVLARIKAKSNPCCAGVHCSPVFLFYSKFPSFFFHFFTVANRFIRCSFT